MLKTLVYSFIVFTFAVVIILITISSNSTSNFKSLVREDLSNDSFETLLSRGMYTLEDSYIVNDNSEIMYIYSQYTDYYQEEKLSVGVYFKVIITNVATSNLSTKSTELSNITLTCDENTYSFKITTDLFHDINLIVTGFSQEDISYSCENKLINHISIEDHSGEIYFDQDIELNSNISESEIVDIGVRGLSEDEFTEIITPENIELKILVNLGIYTLFVTAISIFVSKRIRAI